MSILVAKQAPDFTAPAVMPNGDIEPDFKLSALRGSTVVLFFWPLDFTFVCPTELIAFDNRLERFRERQTRVVGVSIDSEFTHFAWRRTPIKDGGIGPVGFPMVADITHDIVRAYGVQHPEGVACRASFLIDKSGIVQHQVVNNLALGRNVDEMLRMIDALHTHEATGKVCPAGWEPEQEAMEPTLAGVSDFLAAKAESL